MKTLMMTTALALALGLSSGASALTPTHSFSSPTSLESVELVKTSLTDGNDFYQGDFMAGAKTALEGLTQSDLYTGRGASEVPMVRWVTH